MTTASALVIAPYPTTLSAVGCDRHPDRCVYNRADCSDYLIGFGPDNHFESPDFRFTAYGNVNDEPSAFKIRKV